MTNTQNPGGRPEIGPKVETRLSEDVLTVIDGDANKARIKRAEWLRRAALRSLPHATLGDKAHIDNALADTDSWLDGVRDAALDAELSQQEREFRGIAYATCISEMRDAFRQALDSLPVQQAGEAYANAANSTQETPELARLWGKTTGAEMAADILNALIRTLPLDGQRVQDRASLEDPQMDLD